MTSIEPVLDRTRLEALATELDSRPTAVRFMRQFLEMLPTRVVRIKDALAGNDQEAALTAVLSLASSASMVGAHQLAQHCRMIRRELNVVNPTRIRHVSLILDSHTAALIGEITRLLDHAGTDQPGVGLRK